MTAIRGPAPARIRVDNWPVVNCPRRRPTDLAQCLACRLLQGIMDTGDLEILCGYQRGAPLRRPDVRFGS